MIVKTTDDIRGTRAIIKPGTLYALDKHDRHRLRVNEDARRVHLRSTPCGR
jgi:L-ectoine synthase